MVFSRPTVDFIPNDAASYAPHWVVDFTLDNNRIVRPRDAQLDISWEFRPRYAGQTQEGVVLRKGAGTIGDEFLYWDGLNTFVSYESVVPTSGNSVRLTDWATNAEDRVIYQVATVGSGTTVPSDFSAALEVVVGDNPEAELGEVTNGIVTPQGITIGQRPIIDWKARSQTAYHFRVYDGSDVIVDTGKIYSTDRKHTLLMPAGAYDHDVTVTLEVTNDYGSTFSSSASYHVNYGWLPAPRPNVSHHNSQAEIINLGVTPGAAQRYNRVDVWRRFSGNHSPTSLNPASQYNLPYPDEKLIAIDVDYSHLIETTAGVKAFYDATLLSGFDYEYRIVGYDDTGINGPIYRETFNTSDWTG